MPPLGIAQRARRAHAPCAGIAPAPACRRSRRPRPGSRRSAPAIPSARRRRYRSAPGGGSDGPASPPPPCRRSRPARCRPNRPARPAAPADATAPRHRSAGRTSTGRAAGRRRRAPAGPGRAPGGPPAASAAASASKSRPVRVRPWTQTTGSAVLRSPFGPGQGEEALRQQVAKLVAAHGNPRLVPAIAAAVPRPARFGAGSRAGCFLPFSCI